MRLFSPLPLPPCVLVKEKMYFGYLKLHGCGEEGSTTEQEKDLGPSKMLRHVRDVGSLIM